MANTGLLLEVMVVALILFFTLSLFSLHYFSMGALLLNERETERILKALVKSDEVVSSSIAEVRMGVYVNNLVDCTKIYGVCSKEDIYLSCGPFSCGNPTGKVVVRRIAVYNGSPVVVEVGVG